MKQKLKVTVLICTRNRPDCIIDCLKSISYQTTQIDELIVIDSSNTPLICLEQFNQCFNSNTFGNTVLKYRHTKPGLTYQRNYGLSMATGDVYYFFDDDVVIASNYIKEMQRVFAGHAYYIGGMGTISNLLPLKKNFFYFCRIFFLIQRNYASGTFTCSGMPTHSYGLTTFKNIHAIGGCGFAYRARVFSDYRFDEHLLSYAYMEDCDFSKRVCQKYKLFFNPYAHLIHHKSPIARENLLDFRTMFTKHYTYLFFKNFYPENKIKIVAYVWSMFGLLLESIFSTVSQKNISYLYGYWRGIYQYLRTQRRFLP